MSGVTYERSMTLTYPSDYTTLEFKKIVGEMHKRGISLMSYWSWNGPKDEKYGYQTVKTNTTRYWLILNGQRVAALDRNSTVSKIVEQVNVLSDMMAHSEEEEITTSTKKWRDIEGIYGWLDSEQFIGQNERSNHIAYEEGHMVLKIDRDYNGNIAVRFVFTWECEKIQKKADIERVCVNQPLKDMGLVQKKMEQIMKLKRFGGFVGEPTITCHFDAKTESRSECTPDIVAKVRAARSN